MSKVKRRLAILIIVLLVNPFYSIEPNNIYAQEIVEPQMEIATVEQLENIAENLAGNYILVNDIDLEGSEWTPIETGRFTGTFIGDSYTIKNMPVEYETHEYNGLFHTVEDASKIDVHVEFNDDVSDEEEREESDPIEEQATSNQGRLEDSQTENTAKNEEPSELETTATKRTENVSNFSEFKRALENADITEVNLTGNVEASSGLFNRIFIEPRELVVNGNGHEIKQIDRGILTYSMMKVNNGSASNQAKLTFKNVVMYSESENSLFTESGSHDWELTFENVNTGVFAESTGSIVNASHAHVRLSETANFISNANPTINDAKSVTITPNSDVEILAKSGQFYTTGVANAELIVQGKLRIEAQRSESSVIDLVGHDSKMNVDGGILVIDSDRVYNAIKKSSDQLTSGLIRLTGDNAAFNVNKAGNVKIIHQQGTILYMESTNGKININGKDTKVAFEVKGEGSDTNHDAPIHLNKVSDKVKGYEFSLDGGATFEVIKQSGSAMGVRVGQGSQHKVTIKGGSKFKVHNKGDGVARDPAGENGRNQALYYNGELPEFNVSGKGSEVELIADYGVAMHMTGGGIINVNEGSTIIARGRTASADRGIIDTGGVDDVVRSKITLTKPAFYDFKNNNTEGYVFHVGRLAEIEGNNTDISLWERGPNVNLEGPHTFRFLSVYQYIYRGENFKTLSTAATTSKGLKEVQEQYKYGLREFSRISGNNAQAIVDDLYIPTNADQKIYAHVTVDEGIFGSRDAYTDEVEVDILHTLASGNQQLYQGKTIGADSFPTQESYEIYGKSVNSFGWVEIHLPEDAYLKEGETIKVHAARIIGSDLESENTAESDPSNLFAETQTTIDITPPEPSRLKTKELTEYSTFVEGTLTEQDADVIVEVNGEDAQGEVEYNHDHSSFIYTLPHPLKIGDMVQVFLHDQAGEAVELGPEVNQPDRPHTNTEIGNMNPTESMIYHDRTFEEGPIMEVVRAPGELTFVSVPTTLEFKVKMTPYPKEYHVNMDALGNDLVIRDTRETKSNWVLMARLSKPLTGSNNEANILEDALIYRNESFETIIDTEDSIIKSHEYEQSDEPNQEWNITSQEWGQSNNGLFIKIEPGMMKDDYSGEVVWTLSDTP